MKTVLLDKLTYCHTRIMPQHMAIIPPGHSILTPSRPVLSLFPINARRHGGAAERIPILKSLVWPDRNGFEPTVYRRESRRSTNCAIDAGWPEVRISDMVAVNDMVRKAVLHFSSCSHHVCKSKKQNWKFFTKFTQNPVLPAVETNHLLWLDNRLNNIRKENAHLKLDNTN